MLLSCSEKMIIEQDKLFKLSCNKQVSKMQNYIDFKDYLNIPGVH